MRPITIASFAVLVLACGCGASDDQPSGTGEVALSDACVKAQSLFVTCVGRAPSDWTEACDDAKAAEVLGMSCDQLTSALPDAKADGPLLGKAEDVKCWFNFQCKGDLVCRPLSNVIGTEQTCGPRTSSGWCDADSDCSKGYYCCGEHILENGHCGPPGEWC